MSSVKELHTLSEVTENPSHTEIPVTFHEENPKLQGLELMEPEVYEKEKEQFKRKVLRPDQGKNDKAISQNMHVKKVSEKPVPEKVQTKPKKEETKVSKTQENTNSTQTKKNIIQKLSNSNKKSGNKADLNESGHHGESLITDSNNVSVSYLNPSPKMPPQYYITLSKTQDKSENYELNKSRVIERNFTPEKNQKPTRKKSSESIHRSGSPAKKKSNESFKPILEKELNSKFSVGDIAYYNAQIESLKSAILIKDAELAVKTSFCLAKLLHS